MTEPTKTANIDYCKECYFWIDEENICAVYGHSFKNNKIPCIDKIDKEIIK